MPTTSQYLAYAEIALASYGVNLTPGANANAPRYQAAGMAEIQATNFDQQWSVLGQADIGDGFSAVLFQRMDANGEPTGEKVLGIRGSESSHWGVDYLTGAISIALLGTANGMPQYQSLESFYQQLVGTGKLGVGERITIAGHSLGGFLAQAFAAKHDSIVTAAYTYNAPGFSGGTALTNISTQLLEFFGITDASIPNGKIFNLRAFDGLSATAGLGQMIGSVETIAIEKDGIVANHSIETLTDSLAIQALLARFDPGVSLNATNALVRAASNQHESALESLLDALRRLTTGPPVPATGIGDRDALHANCRALIESQIFVDLGGRVRIELSGTGLAARARNDFGALASLITLSPLTLAGYDAASQAVLDSTLQAAWGQTYTDWLADKNMTIAERAAGKGTTTDAWIVDRTAMLVAINAKNMRDEPYPTTSYGDGLKPTTRYVDLASGITLNSGDASSTQLAQIVFGSDAGDARSGGNRSDRLYGGGGNDNLSGGDGDDRLEGQSGDDMLGGGDGMDTLYGGAGNDTLSGDAGNDLLLGGAGDDTYTFAEGWGHDIVKDSDGLGRLDVVGYGSGLPQGKKIAAGTYRSADGAVTYTLDGTRLLITFADRSDTIMLEQWSPATNLGITFDETVTAPETWASLTGTEAADVLHFPNLADSETLVGLGGDDTLGSPTISYNTSGNLPDSLFAVQHDVMDGGSGDDLIYGGDGADTIVGGAGADEIYGGIHAEGFYWTYFGLDESNPQPWVDVNFSAGRRALDSNTIDAGDGDDAVVAGWGNDVVHAGLGADNVIGQAGADVLWGDDGNDVLWGDGAAKYEWDQAWWNQIWADQGQPADQIVISYELGNLSCDQAYTPAYLHGDDVLVGGLGDDRLVGMGGADELVGGDGDDRLYGDTYFDQVRTIQLSTAPLDVRANDWLDGGAGADHLFGDAGDDSLYGGAGNDKLWGDFDSDAGLPVSYHGADHLDGGEGDDLLTGGGSDDVMIGGDGADTMLGDDKQSKVAVSAHGRDVMEGGDGNDLMVGGGGADEMYGDAGDDQMLGDDLDLAVDASAHGADLLDGGAGNDQLRGGGGGDNLHGGAGDDVLRGDDVLAALVPSAHGDDWLAGDAGVDTLYGDGGNDTLVGGTDADYLSGGEGSDSYLYGIGHGSDVIDNRAADGATAVDSLQLAGISPDSVSASRFRDDLIVRINGGDAVTVSNHFASVEYELDRIAFADGTSWDAAQIAARLQAGVGTDDSDRLGGTAGADVIAGGAGDDQIIGGEGDDVLTGGAGSDTYFFDLGFGVDVVDEAGTDAADDRNWIVLGAGMHTGNVFASNWLTSRQQYDLAIDVYGPDLMPTGDSIVVKGFFAEPNATSSIDGIRFADGTEWDAEWIHQHFYAQPGSRPGNAFSGKYTDDTLIGLDADEALTGLAGDDTIHGNGGADYLFGDNGNDTLHGGSGDDHLYGGAGNDVLDGGGGNDSLNGGAGDDVYRFGRGGGQDSVDELVPMVGDADVIRFDTDIAPSEIEVVHPVIDGAIYLDYVSLRIAGTTDSIKTYGWWQGTDLISRVEFADGTVWSATDVARRLPTTGTGDSAAVYGSGLDDVIRGNAGDDDLWGGRGGDVYVFGAGDGFDVVTEIVDGGQNVIRFDAGMSAADVVVTRSETSVMLTYGIGDLIRIGGWSPGASAPIQRVEFADGTVWQSADLLARVGIGSARDDGLHGSTLDDSLRGMAGNDSLTGHDGNDVLDGGTGNDWLTGGAGDDVYLYGAAGGSETIENDDASATSVDTLRFDASITPAMLRVMRNPADLLIDLPGVADQILLPNAFGDASARIDRVEFADGTVWTWDDVLARIAGPSEDWDWLVGSDGADVIDGLGGADRIYGLAGDDSIFGGGDRDYLVGGEGADWLMGDGGDDGLEGSAGADSLTGGAGNDALGGGAGIDTYFFAPGFGHDIAVDFLEADGSANVLRFQGLTPSQIIVSRTDVALYLVADGTLDHLIIDEWFDVEELHAFDVRFDDGTVWNAGSLESRINGTHATIGDDVLYGSAGNDVIAGLAGDDIASGGGGSDLVRGGDGNDTLFGSLGNAVLEGGVGDDDLFAPNLGRGFLVGGRGDDDVAIWGEGNQVVAFNVGDGNDRLELGDTGAGVVLSIGGGAQVGDIWLGRDEGGSELVIGIGANDSIRVSGYTGDASPALVLQLLDASGVRLFDLSASIADFMNLPASSPDIGHWPAHDALAANQLGWSPSLAYGGQLAYQYALTGSLAAVSDATAQQMLSDPQFASVVQSVVPEAIQGTSGDDTLTGTPAADVLMGQSGNDTLDGGPGADRMVGGVGDDTYVVDDAGDTVVESPAEGMDVVLSAITTTLAENVESLTLTGSSAIDGTGNALDNVLVGNGAVNVLAGGAGDDVYVVASGDTVIEGADQGVDSVQSSVSWTLGANQENLELTGVLAINATGNALDNVLVGNSAANSMAGGAGNDTYLVGAGDTVVEAAGAGIDEVLSPVSWSLGANVERLTLTGASAVSGSGNALANTIQGNAADNTLNGGGGADHLFGGAGNDTLNGGNGSDTMAGGSGNDTFVVDTSADVVTELADEGIDTVMSSVTLRLGDNVENMTLIGSNSINAGGNALDNVLTGNSASNQLAGGAGNDSYVVGSGDTVTEAAGAGIDTVISSVTWVLGSNLENLSLTGAAAINGAGNALDNLLIGNSAANTLRGAAGRDTYDGGAGNDVLNDQSSTSGDIYRWGIGSGTDAIIDSGGTDRVDIGAGITESQLAFSRNGNHLELTLAGQPDRLIVANWYVSPANQIEEFRLSDGSSVFAAEVQSLVSAMAVFSAAQETAADVGRETILPMHQPDSLWSVSAVM